MKINYKIVVAAIFSMLLTLLSCDKWVDVPAPTNKLEVELIFKDTNSIKTLIRDIYFRMGSSNVGTTNLTLKTALISDELKLRTEGQILVLTLSEPYLCSYSASSTYFDTWNGPSGWYSPIYQTNVILENLSKTENLKLTNARKNQFFGEARTLRALQYFNLSKCYGDVPLIKSTDLSLANVTGRTTQEEVINFITEELVKALDELPIKKGDVRFLNCRFQAEALLAKVYLQREMWKEAEDASSSVINSGYYQLESDLNRVFKRGSKETIFAIGDTRSTTSTSRALIVSLLYSSKRVSDIQSFAQYIAGSFVMYPSLSDQLLNSFENNDKRSFDGCWLKKHTYNSYNFAIPFKYKNSFSSLDNDIAASNPEDEVWIRLAEIYLTRSEARAKQNKLSEAVACTSPLNNWTKF